MNTKRLLTFILILAVIGSIFALSVFAAAPIDDGYDDGYDGGYDDENDGEYEEYEPPFTPEGGRAILIILAALFGIVIPLIPLTFYLVRLITKRKRIEPVDFVIIGISALWVILGIVLLVIVM